MTKDTRISYIGWSKFNRRTVDFILNFLFLFGLIEYWGRHSYEYTVIGIVYTAFYLCHLILVILPMLCRGMLNKASVTVILKETQLKILYTSEGILGKTFIVTIPKDSVSNLVYNPKLDRLTICSDSVTESNNSKDIDVTNHILYLWKLSDEVKNEVLAALGGYFNVGVWYQVN